MLRKPLIETHPRVYRKFISLNKEIWLQRTDSSTGRHWSDEKRKLTNGEKRLSFSLLKSNRVICCMHDRWGFTLYITLYSYPASAKETPERIITIHQSQLGIERSGLNFPTKKGDGTAWSIFSQFTHTKENKDAIKFFGLDPIEKKSHYSYL